MQGSLFVFAETHAQGFELLLVEIIDYKPFRGSGDGRSVPVPVVPIIFFLGKSIIYHQPELNILCISILGLVIDEEKYTKSTTNLSLFWPI